MRYLAPYFLDDLQKKWFSCLDLGNMEKLP